MIITEGVEVQSREKATFPMTKSVPNCIVLEEPEICICAAVIANDDRIFRGHRHHNCLGALADMNLKLKQGHSNETQGFITSKNRYVTRREAFYLQKAAGIKSVNPDGYRGKELYSEDLY